jgi:amino acid transporter
MFCLDDSCTTTQSCGHHLCRGVLHVFPIKYDLEEEMAMTQLVRPQEHAHGKALLGPLLCWAVVFADIGSSIYYVPGILFSNVGGLAGFFVLLTMIVFVLLTLKYAEVSARFPEGGGVVSVAAQGIHRWAGALGGMFILVSYFLTAAISCLSAIQYFAIVFPALLPFVLIIAIGVLFLLGVLNWIGISESARVSMIAALIAFGSDLVVLIVVFTHVSFQQVIELFLQSFQQQALTTSSLLIGFAGAFLAFSGLESISQLSPVMKAPRKKVISLALLLVILTIGITSPLLTALSTLLQPDAARDEVLSTQLISLLGGHWGHIFIQQEVAVSASLILIFAGNTAIIGAYHVFLALARMDFLPTFVLRRNRLRNTPQYSIALATGIPILVLLLVNGKINLLGDMYAFGLLAAFSLTCLGLDIIRIRERRHKPTAPVIAAEKQNGHTPSLTPLLPGFSELTALHTENRVALAASHTLLRRVRAVVLFCWHQIDFWLGILTTILVFLAWIIGVFSKPLGTAFGGTVILVGMSVAIINYIRQGRTFVLPTPLETRVPGSILAVLMGSGRHNEEVIESALQEASYKHPVVFLYVSDLNLARTPRPFEIIDPYLEDLDAKETFRQAERLARVKGVPRRYLYQHATPETLAYVWRIVRPHDVILPKDLMDEAWQINPDRLRYERRSKGSVAHLVKHW